MTTHTAGTRDDWRAERLELLAAEKELTRRSDELARRRRALPWVALDKPYLFETEEGEKTLRDLFDGRHQLLVYHFMFGPDWDEGCPSCSFWADNFDRAIVHLNHRDVSMVCVSRAPLASLQAYRRRMGWTFEWASSAPSDFNFDFGVSFAEDRRARAEHNFEVRDDVGEEHAGLSAFALEDGIVYHTYSCYSRGLEAFNAAYQLLDRAPAGRDEDDLPFPAAWLRRRDAYDERT